uniref:BOS complex subunit NCLN n=1 Tax=Steinernema glaseri TaxID=37863 RepID=A0A1I7ZA51_9BILA
MQDEILDAIRNPSFLVYLSILLAVCSQLGASDNVELGFTAYRLQQFDMQSNQYGSRSSRVAYEAVSLNADTLRKSVIVHWTEMLQRNMADVFGKSVGAMVIVIPADLSAFSEENEFLRFEKSLSLVNTELAVFVAPWSEALASLLADVKTMSDRTSTATQQLLNVFAGNTFQLSSGSSGTPTPVDKRQHFNVVGRLAAHERGVPTLVFVAHHDSYGIVPALSPGADSNGSGMVALFELMAIFQRFYENAATRPKYNMLFIASAAGKFSYQGARQWLDDYIEKPTEERIELVLCLDTIGNGDDIRMHVAKVPKDESAAMKIFKRMESLLADSNRKVEMVKLAINRNSDFLNWEHERFNLKRMPAVTLSRLATPNDPSRNSMLDTVSRLNLQVLESNIRLVAEAVLGHVFNLPASGCSVDAGCSLLGTTPVESERIAAFVAKFASQPRSAAVPSRTLVNELRDLMNHYTGGHATLQQVTLVDVALYGPEEDKIVAHRVKPAIFDLFIGVAVMAYLFVFYQLVSHAQSFIERFVGLVSRRSAKKTV